MRDLRHKDPAFRERQLKATRKWYAKAHPAKGLRRSHRGETQDERRERKARERRTRYATDPKFRERLIAQASNQASKPGYRKRRNERAKRRRREDGEWAEHQRQYARDYARTSRERRNQLARGCHQRRMKSDPMYRESKREADRTRRARELEQLGTVSPLIKTRLIETQENCCAICGVSLADAYPELDHIVPLAKGGLHDDENLQVLCRHCNRSKQDK